MHDHKDPETVQKVLSEMKTNDWIQPEQIADAFVFLAKNDAITGEVVYADSGYRVR